MELQVRTEKILVSSISVLLLHIAFNTNAKTITVGNFTELLNGINAVESGDTILMRDGTYIVNNGYGVQVTKSNIVIKSLSNDREKVIVTGGGMTGGAQYGFWIPESNVTIQGMTIQDVIFHCIQTDVENHKLRVIDCVLRDAHQQLLKIPASDQSAPSDSGLVEGCLFEFTKGVADDSYTGGIDCHRGKDWVVRNNTFRNIRSPGGSIAEHAIHFWNKSENIMTEKNLIIDCDRGIGYGMGSQAVHRGGIIRNNMIYHRKFTGTDFGDVGIGLENCVNVHVYNNTVCFDNNYQAAIEYRFIGSTGNTITNNLTNKIVWQRDDASATLSNNITDAQATWFRSPSTGDLHLASAMLTTVIDKGILVQGLTEDFDGQTRPQSTNIDIGADEYTASQIRNTSPSGGYKIKLLHQKTSSITIPLFNHHYSPNVFYSDNALFDLNGRVNNTNAFKSTLLQVMLN